MRAVDVAWTAKALGTALADPANRVQRLQFFAFLKQFPQEPEVRNTTPQAKPWKENARPFPEENDPTKINQTWQWKVPILERNIIL